MAPRIPAEVWEERKGEILRLYLDKGFTLGPVMRAMQSQDFNPTESQYRTKLKQWKRRKPRKCRKQKTESIGGQDASLHSANLSSESLSHPSTCISESNSNPSIFSPPHITSHHSIEVKEYSNTLQTTPSSTNFDLLHPFDPNWYPLAHSFEQSQHSTAIVPDPAASLSYSDEQYHIPSLRRKSLVEAQQASHNQPRVSRDVRCRSRSSEKPLLPVQGQDNVAMAPKLPQSQSWLHVPEQAFEQSSVSQADYGSGTMPAPEVYHQWWQ